MELFGYIMLIVISIVNLLLVILLNSANRDLRTSLMLNEDLLKDNKLLMALIHKELISKQK